MMNVEAIPCITQGRFRPSHDLGIDIPYRGTVRGPDEDVGVGISQQLAHERGRERLLGRWLKEVRESVSMDLLHFGVECRNDLRIIGSGQPYVHVFSLGRISRLTLGLRRRQWP